LALISPLLRTPEPSPPASQPSATAPRQRLLSWRRPAAAQKPTSWQPSHRALLTAVDPGADDVSAPQAPDLVVVSTAYSHAIRREGLVLAAELARDCRARLLVLCSKDACSRASLEGLEKLLRNLGVLQAHVVQLTPQASSLTTFEVDGLWVSQAWRRGGARAGEPRLAAANDVGRKRNIALAAAVVMGAGTVLFLDDDIFLGEGASRHPRTLERARLSAAVRAVGSARCRPSGGRPSTSTTTPFCSASGGRWDFRRGSSSVPVHSW
jgi:hypothetical protein